MQKSIFILVIVWLSAGAALAQQKVAVVDLRNVFESFYKKKQSDDAFKREAQDMEKERTDMVDSAKKIQDDWKKLVDNANDQAISADERAKAKDLAEDKLRDLNSQQQAIQEYDRVSLAKLQEEKRNKRDTLVAEIRDHLNTLAKAGAYNLVFDVSGESANMLPVVVYNTGLPDLTDPLIKELNAGAPADASSSSASAAPAPAPLPQ